VSIGWRVSKALMVEPFNTGFPRSLLASCRMTGLRQPFASPARRKRPVNGPRFQNRATALAHHIKRGALSWVLWALTELAGAVIAAWAAERVDQ
jgi:hypothetical protein